MTLPEFFAEKDPSFVWLSNTELTESPFLVLVQLSAPCWEISSELVTEMFLLTSLMLTVPSNSATGPWI